MSLLRFGCAFAVIAAAAACTSSTPSATSEPASPSPDDAGAAPNKVVAATDAGTNPAPDSGASDTVCNATFCDDFEREVLAAEDWTLASPSPEWATEASLDAIAFNGTHAARFHTNGVPTDDTEDEHTSIARQFPVKSAVDLSFEFYARQTTTAANDFAQVLTTYLPTGEGQPLAVLIEQQVTAQGPVLVLEIPGSPAAKGFAITTAAWHHVRVVVDATQRTATLSVDGTAGDAVPFSDSFTGLDFTNKTWSLTLGPENTSGAPSVDFNYDAFRLTAQ